MKSVQWKTNEVPVINRSSAVIRDSLLANLRGWIHGWNSQVTGYRSSFSPNKQQTEYHLPTYRAAQQDGGLWDSGSYDWHGLGRKTMSGTQRKHFYLKPTSAKLFSMQYHSPFSFLFMMTPVERWTIPGERDGKLAGGYTKKIFIIKIKSEAIPSEFTFTNGENNGVAK